MMVLHVGVLVRDPVKGPCLHRPENWLVRQLNDESKPGYKVGFIREKGKATARKLTAVAPRSLWLAAQVKAGVVFVDILTLG
jgi:hypothetical protein